MEGHVLIVRLRWDLYGGNNCSAETLKEKATAQSKVLYEYQYMALGKVAV